MTDPFTSIPAELRSLHGWLVWRSEQTAGEAKPRKVPYYVDGVVRHGKQGGDADRRRLASFDEACAALLAHDYAGLGFAMLGDWGLVGLDFDNCVKDGRIAEPVAVAVAGTYSELSPSGTGVRAFVLGILPDRKSRAVGDRFGFETFCTKGFLTITGQVTDVAELTWAGRLTRLNGTIPALFADRFGSTERAILVPGGPPVQGLSDAELRRLLSFHDPDAPYRGASLVDGAWISVGMALHHETRGGERGLDLWVEHSERGTKYPGRERLEYLYERFGDAGGGPPITANWLRMVAEARGGSAALDDSAFPVVVVESRRAEPKREGVCEFPGESGDELPAFDREKSGAVKPTVSNAVAAVRRADVAGMRVGHDLFRDEVTVSEVGQDAWRPMTDADLVRMRIQLERLGFKSVPKELARDAVVLVAAEHEYDSAQLWLSGLEGTWDGVPRVEGFFRDYFGAGGAQGARGAGGKEGGGEAYARAVSLYLWTALAGRVMDPGCQADMAPILEGGQGLRKTSAIAALVPDPQFFVEVDLELDETATARMLRGTLVGEIGELRGLHTKDQESIKKFISRRHEKWVPKYKEFSTTFARRLVFVGTTNRTDLLADETGNRRWLPLHVERADVEGIVRDRLQMWAEAVELWRGKGGAGGAEGGVQWRDAEALAPDAHRDYEMGDAWDGPVERWLAEDDGFQASGDGSSAARALPRGTSPFTVYELAQGALGMAAKDINMLALKRIGAILCRLGYTKHTLRHEGKLAKHWVQTKHPKP